jgi:hypothetical protein
MLPSLTAAAQQADLAATTDPADTSAAAPQAIGYGAMPGGLHAPSAETLPKGAVQVSTLTGLGRRTGLLGENHKFNRAIGNLAVSYGATPTISVGLALDGRYDRHWGLAPSGDDGYVGDPKLIVRAAQSTGSVAFGGQLGIWIPGKDAPSIAASAISVDARALVSLPAGPGLLSFSGGFRLDNSAKSVDEPLRLSLQDRVSLGVSDYHALFGAAQLRIPFGKAWLGLEGSLDAFIGGPPDPEMDEVKRAELARSKLIFRGGATAGFQINDQISALVFVEATKVPGINIAQVMDNNIPLIPYEPIFTGGIGLQARFGTAKKSGPLFVEKDCARRNPPDCPAVKAPLLTEISGSVLDSAGKPVVGAKVSLTLKVSQVEPVVTDGKGAFTFKGVPIGSTIEGKSTVEETAVRINVELDGMKPGTASISQVAQGTNTVPPITLEPVLPPGQLRGVVRSLKGGKLLKGATVVVEPGGAKAETADDGTFQIDLAPGTYKIKVTAAGLKPQELDVTIEPNGVAIKNIDLQ